MSDFLLWIKRNRLPLAAWSFVLLAALAGALALAQYLGGGRVSLHHVFRFEDPHRIKYLIVHHSLSAWGDRDAIMRWHTAPPPAGNGWSSPGYHAIIENGYPTWEAHRHGRYNSADDGRVVFLWPQDRWVTGVRFGNKNALQVCLIRNCDKTKPSEKQWAALIDLLARWCIKPHLDPRRDIYGHGEMQRRIARENYSKTCPGRNVDMNAVRAAVFQKTRELSTPHPPAPE